MRQLRNILNRILEFLAAISFLVMVVLTCWQVFTRYVLQNPSSWSEELVSYMFAWMALLGASIVVGERGHMNIPIVVERMGKGAQLFFSIFSEVVACVFAAVIYAETDGVPHNTITPIARMRDGKYELDLVLRNNLTTPEHPLGLYHPHAQLHHIKKENIGLIEVMGLAVLPARLKEELAAVADALVTGADLRSSELTEKHADWAEGFRDRYAFTRENALDIVQKETGLVFAQVLEHAGVYKRTPEGREAFLRFLRTL